MQHFLQVLDEYAMIEVIQAAWENLRSKLPTLNSFDQLVQLHQDYLDEIMDKCFVTKTKTNRVMTLLD